jgi:hypothetical protein
LKAYDFQATNRNRQDSLLAAAIIGSSQHFTQKELETVRRRRQALSLGTPTIFFWGGGRGSILGRQYMFDAEYTRTLPRRSGCSYLSKKKLPKITFYI